MDRIVIVGSGASAVHFALTVLKKGYRVLMLDSGGPPPGHPRPHDNFIQLKERLADPAEYFLGRRQEALVLPSPNANYYAFPPSKTFIFDVPHRFGYCTDGFYPLISFSAGGLAEAWTGGSYPFREEELERFPFDFEELAPYYGEVALRIGISGRVDDDLSPFFPAHEGILSPLDLDEHSRLLLETYANKRTALKKKHRFAMGRSRIAALPKPLHGRCGCSYCGRCQWGCPSGAFYTPSLSLEQCRSYENFEYSGRQYVDHFRFDSAGRIRSVVCHSMENGTTHEVPAGTLVLAAGALSSSNIFLRSIYLDSGERVTLGGLMDNRQILMPFLNLRMLGKRYNPETYQYHQIAMAVEGERPLDYIHGLVTTLKTAVVHPVIQTLPFDLATSAGVFRNIRAGLGLVNINFPDSRREENYLALDIGATAAETRLLIHYRPTADEPDRMKRTAKTFRRVLGSLGCLAPQGMTRMRPMGSSVHYAGTVPMRESYARLACSKDCRSYDFENLYFADGTSFPDLPSKNLTFTLMANAARVADRAF
jgi:choline dehydrogenase-like flavoprotein